MRSVVGQKEFVGLCVYKQYWYSTKSDVDMDVCAVGATNQNKTITQNQEGMSGCSLNSRNVSPVVVV